jgi:hypothetical protein
MTRDRPGAARPSIAHGYWADADIPCTARDFDCPPTDMAAFQRELPDSSS